MLLEELATEILFSIFMSCLSITDVISLASTCRRFHMLYKSAGRLSILERAAEVQYGPLADAIQLVTHNSSQPTHSVRKVPLSLALLQQIVKVGRIAKRWEGIYPLKKWKHDFEDRRLLSREEAFIFRRALYRLWLYSRAFHNPDHTRYVRLIRHVVLERAELLHNWGNLELAEIADVQRVIREVLRSNVCPSNGTVQRKFYKRFPDSNQHLVFNMHHSYPPITVSEAVSPRYYSNNNDHLLPRSDRYRARFGLTQTPEPMVEGWGDDIAHYYVVEDMLKLDPAQILWLKDNATSKHQIQMYVTGLGEWFDNNGETFGQTLEYVLAERGINVEQFMDSVQLEDQGVVHSYEQAS